MPELVFPQIAAKPVRKQSSRTCAGHRAWVKRHRCSIRGCQRTPIECAHVRSGTDGGVGLKPSDRWVISLCLYHHREQHHLGEPAFEEKYSLDLVAMAMEFARRSPHWLKLRRMIDRISDESAGLKPDCQQSKFENNTSPEGRSPRSAINRETANQRAYGDKEEMGA